jgi:hypothetical protein
LFDPVSVDDGLGSPSPRLCCATPITIFNIDIFSPVFAQPGRFDIAAALLRNSGDEGFTS